MDGDDRQAPRKRSSAKASHAARELACELVSELERCKASGCYPTTLQRLKEAVAPQATSSQVFQAANQRTAFLDKVTLSRKQQLAAPLVLRGDEPLLADTPELLEFAFQQKRTAKDHFFSVADLIKLLSVHLKGPFRSSVERRIQDGSLPEGFGWAWIKSSRKLFRVADLHLGGQTAPSPPAMAPSTPAMAPSPPAMVPSPPAMVPAASASAAPSPASPAVAAPAPPPAAAFSQEFEAAFDRLNALSGGHNFVSLVELRRALAGVSRAEFDAGLRKLRIDRRFSLSAAQSKHGISPEEREAGIEDAGDLLLYVSRRQS